ncbi:hypothetical protein LINPERPRIM_LOCUS39578 [Linum perenne]
MSYSDFDYYISSVLFKFLQEVEEYDDYEDDGEEEEEEEEEYEEVEERKPTAEEMEFLNYRERRKELIRRKRLKESGASAGRSLDNKKKLPLESFGSFFGPSQPVIAPRVIQERKTLLENPHIARRIENPQRSVCFISFYSSWDAILCLYVDMIVFWLSI